MKSYRSRFLRLLFGLFLYALGIAVTMRANIGYAPWDVFHAGISATVGLSIGVVSIIAGFCLVILTLILGEKLGLGTILNMILIGIFLDIILYANIFPLPNSFIPGVIMMIIGLFVIALGSYFYIGSGFGAGPRDSLMVALNRKTGLPVGFCRGSIELSVLIVGWFLGGMVGVGTIISALSIGFCVQTTFKILGFDVAKVPQEDLLDTLGKVKLLCQN